jgi:hypothetical protein
MKDEEILNNVLKYWSDKEDREIRDSTNAVLPITASKILGRPSGEISVHGRAPVDVGITYFAYMGKFIVFHEYLHILKVINTQYGITPGNIICGSPGIGVYPSPC